MSFYTTFLNLNWSEKGRIAMEDVAARVNDSAEKYPVNTKPMTIERQKSVGKTAQRIIDMVISDPSINREKMAEKLGISIDGVKKQIKKLRDLGILVHEGSDKSGYWRIIAKP